MIIVSAYYKIPSKSTHGAYVPNLIRWFRSIRGTIHFFTTQDVIDELRTHVSVDHVIFHLLPFEQLTAMTKWGRPFWERQKARDPETYHTPELGMIWYEKKRFVERIMELYPDEPMFCWCDAGCIRDDASEHAATKFGTRGVQLNDDMIHFQTVGPYVFKQFYHYEKIVDPITRVEHFPDTCIAGAIIIGNRTAWTQYIKQYDDMLKKYDEYGHCGISDQYISYSCISSTPHRYCLHPGTVAISGWFKFLELL